MWCVQAAARRLCFFETFCRRSLALCTCEELHEVSMSLMAAHDQTCLLFSRCVNRAMFFPCILQI